MDTNNPYRVGSWEHAAWEVGVIDWKHEDWYSLSKSFFDAYEDDCNTKLNQFSRCYWKASKLLSKKGHTFDELIKLIARKQRDYGHKNILQHGYVGIKVRLFDKIARFENLTSSGKDPENESVVDTLFDICGYSIIAYMLDNNTFELPLQENMDSPTENVQNRTAPVEIEHDYLGDKTDVYLSREVITGLTIILEIIKTGETVNVHVR